MIRKPTFSGKSANKDEEDILFWAYEKTAIQRLEESWRLNCLNHQLDPNTARMERRPISASKRSS
ncbi:hypothetical protein [Fulvivirga lutea]|uniref:Uncharacterized protein n=1 Tax=Fulvivirga lutea TaxID=2810512 RepID=A0A974WMM1_9BACT|nr:hypothetical protein [Fulvivirga lutea]QSE99065.1 hypothetical protein JR347_08255 [Fulvivirga lutea]